MTREETVSFRGSKEAGCRFSSVCVYSSGGRSSFVWLDIFGSPIFVCGQQKVPTDIGLLDYLSESTTFVLDDNTSPFFRLLMRVVVEIRTGHHTGLPLLVIVIFRALRKHGSVHYLTWLPRYVHFVQVGLHHITHFVTNSDGHIMWTSRRNTEHCSDVLHGSLCRKYFLFIMNNM